MKTFHTLITWILLLALPMQGFATAAMMASPHMTLPAMHAQAPDAGEPCAHDAGADTDTDAGAGQCKQHSTCQLPAALPAAQAGATASHPARSQPIAYLGADTGVCLPGGLERPPHTFA